MDADCVPHQLCTQEQHHQLPQGEVVREGCQTRIKYKMSCITRPESGDAFISMIFTVYVNSA